MEGTKLVFADIQIASYASVLDTDWFIVGEFFQPARLLYVQNLTDQLLLFSTDAVTSKFALPANGFLLLDVGTNKGTPDTASIPAGQGIFVKAPTATLPTTGAIYLSYLYAS